MNMVSKFSDKVKDMEGSAIRATFKLLANPNIISFAGGAPAKELFPKDKLAEISKEVLEKNGEIALQYGVTEGYEPLRQWVINRLKNQNNVCDNDNVIIVSGGQQGIDLAAKSLVNPGDGVICEEPSFIGGLNTFRSNNAELFGVEVESDGINMEMLEDILKKHSNIKVLYTIPTFQNPSGITMSLEKRKKLLEIANKYDIVIFEDNPYGELRFAGEDVPTLKSLDTEGRVVYLGTFSKILSPGLRLGYVSADAALIERMVICKQVQDVHTNVLSQMIAYEFVTKYDIDAHIKNLCTVYGKRAKLMMECMDKYFPKCVSHTNPEGGLFLFCDMPEKYDTKEIMQIAVENNIAFVPGSNTMIDDKKKCSSFRMNYSAANEQQIEKGVKLLGELLCKITGDTPKQF